MNGYCDQKDCPTPSDVRPVLLLFAPPPHEGPPVRARIVREYCRAHGQALTVELFMTEENWQCVLRAFKNHGRLAPDRSRLQLVLEPVVHAERN